MKPWIASLLLASAALMAQKERQVSTTLGGDQMFGTYGLQTQFKHGNLSGWTGMGMNDENHLIYGAYLQIPIGKTIIGAGDQILPGLLDVDEYDTHNFTARGLSVNRISKTSSLQAFSGYLTQEYDFPYLHTGSTHYGSLDKKVVSSLTYQRRLSEDVQMHTLMLLGDKLTSITSVGWEPSDRWKFAGAMGMGSGEPYFAVRGDFHSRRFESLNSYTVASRDFRRQQTPIYSNESLGLNSRVVLTPTRRLKIRLEHDKSVTYLNSYPTVVSTMDSANLNVNLKKTQLNSAVSRVESDRLMGHTLIEVLSASRTVVPRWRVFGAFINFRSPIVRESTSIVTNEFKVSNRLNLRQNYNHMGGQNNYSFGGTLLTNRLSFSVDQQVYISPVASSFGAKSVFQAWTFNVRLRTPHSTSVNLNTIVSPDGKMQWGGYLNGLRYSAVAAPQDTSPTFSKYAVQGKVVDENGKGVEGIALMVGAETVLSDSNGEFFTHVKNTKQMPFAVVADASIQQLRWTLTSAPTAVYGTPVGTSAPVRVVVQMANHSHQIAQTARN